MTIKYMYVMYLYTIIHNQPLKGKAKKVDKSGWNGSMVFSKLYGATYMIK